MKTSLQLAACSLQGRKDQLQPKRLQNQYICVYSSNHIRSKTKKRRKAKNGSFFLENYLIKIIFSCEFRGNSNPPTPKTRFEVQTHHSDVLVCRVLRAKVSAV